MVSSTMRLTLTQFQAMLYVEQLEEILRADV